MDNLRETMRRILRPALTERMNEPSILGLARSYGLLVAKADIVADEQGNDKITIYLSRPARDKFVRAFKRDLRRRNPGTGRITLRSLDARQEPPGQLPAAQAAPQQQPSRQT